ncbi:MAG: MBL fold metallo-hydrolase [Actinomycetota bacterium]|nr:MBL fold metallo-hydrolase [Actinomycetota bacterium]
MYLESLTIGMLATNCYILAAGPRSPALVIDPAGEIKRIVSRLHKNELECVGILCTHGHVDHMAGAGPLSDAVGAPVYIHEKDACTLASPRTRLVGLVGGVLATRPRQVRYLEEGDHVNAGEISMKVLYTPGHTAGGLSFYLPGYLFCGDLIFQDSIGRTDLKGGSLQTLLRSVREKVWDMPDDTRIMTGHGPTTTVGEEKRTNPFLMGLDSIPDRRSI